jgi:predicted 3-demethylubiquinone-9 3-methyltransferase (glyoxalase superfamily)
MPEITPWLWFDDQAEEAAEFYVSLFPDSKVIEVTRYGPQMPLPEGSVMSVVFTLGGREFAALNGGPDFSFTEAVSFAISCRDQEEADRYWAALTADGGQESQCGWLKDRFGLSWQVVPQELQDILRDPDPERGQRATQALMGMRKIDLAELRRAAAGG